MKGISPVFWLCWGFRLRLGIPPQQEAPGAHSYRSHEHNSPGCDASSYGCNVDAARRRLWLRRGCCEIRRQEPHTLHCDIL